MRRLEWILTILLLAVILLVLLAYMGGCNMAVGFPDWTRAVRLLGIDADGNLVTLRTDADGMLVIPIQGEDSEGNLTPVLVDASGRIIMVAYGTIEVGGEIDVVQTDSIREVQGAEGETLRTLAVDSSGQIIMVPRGTSGYYMSVNADGYLTAVITGINPGGGSTGVAVDSDGQIIMVPRGSSGNYMAVDASGFLSAILKGEKPDTSLANVALDASGRIIMVPYGTTTVEGTATVTQDDSVREMQGADGETLRTVVVDAAGRMIMVPRGESGHYMLVDSAGFLSAILKGEKPDTSLANVALDASGRIIMVPYGTTTVEGTATVTQDDSVREMQGADGETLRTIVVDAAGRMIMVPRGESGYYMAVDPDGFITAVLKGLHNSTLTTIALDASGRIYGYQVDDLDQWGETLLVGNAEQAARLGSPVTWDRRGQVQAVFNFERGLHGVREVTSGAGAAIELSPVHWQSGGYSVKLTGGSDVNMWAHIDVNMAVPPSDVWGCAIHWTAEQTPAYLELRLQGVIENTFYAGNIRYDFANTKLQYQDTGNNWQDIGTKDLEILNHIWHRMKVVIDVGNEVFVRALLNNTQYDMSAAISTSSAPTVGDYATCEVYCISNSGDNDVVYIDTLIFTVKEPT